MTGIEHAKGTTNLGTYSYTYDAEDRLASATVPTPTGSNTTDYAYDDTDQLTAADHSAQSDESYAWDANGNRTSGGSVTETGNRIAEDATHTYLYDDAGNLLRETQKSNGAYRVYWWDHRDRLVRVVFRTSAGTLTQQVAYNYDAFDRLVRRQVDGNGDGTFEASQTFVYDGNQIVLVFDEAETVTNRLLWNDAAVDQLFADENDLGEVLWSLTDHQGSVGAVVGYNAGTDTTTVVNRLDYDAFGNVVAESNPAKTPLFQFTGRYHDPLTGKQWNLHRWYDARTGRWLSRDPIGFQAGDANLYRYVGSGPGNATDPSGLLPPRDTGYRWYNPFTWWNPWYDNAIPKEENYYEAYQLERDLLDVVNREYGSNYRRIDQVPRDRLEAMGMPADVLDDLESPQTIYDDEIGNAQVNLGGADAALKVGDAACTAADLVSAGATGAVRKAALKEGAE